MLDFSGPGITHGLRVPANSFEMQDVILAGGPYGIDVVQTDAAGQASVQWTLGTLAGACRLRAVHGDSVVEFSATATPSANQSLVLVSGGGQNGTPGQTLPAPSSTTNHVTDEEPSGGAARQMAPLPTIAGTG